MDPFELKVDTNIIYIKIIRFLGTLLLGFFIGMWSIKYQYNGSIDWMSAFVGILCSLAFAFFPGAASQKTITLNNEGIFLKNHPFWNGKKEFSWSSIKEVKVKKNRIELTKNIGSTERIKLPIHTKDQIKNLKKYLQQLSTSKEITYEQ